MPITNPWESCLANTKCLRDNHYLSACVVLSHVRLCDPMDCSLPDSSFHGILWARILEWVTMPSSRGSSWPTDWTCVSWIAGRFLLSHWGSPVCIWACIWLYSRASTHQYSIKIWFLYHFNSVGWNFILYPFFCASHGTAAAAAKLLQSCPTLCDPIDGSPPGSPVLGILQARTLEWVAISFSNAWKWKVKVKSLSHVRLLVTPWTAAYKAPLSMGFSRQEYWSGVPSPSLDTAPTH